MRNSRARTHEYLMFEQKNMENLNVHRWILFRYARAREILKVWTGLKHVTTIANSARGLTTVQKHGTVTDTSWLAV